MQVLLVQHAEATPKDQDPERPLTEKGIQDIRKVAKFLFNSGWPCKKIFHSGKLRADQSAGHLLDVGFPNAEVKATDGLAPKDPVQPMAEKFALEAENLILVGHLPFMEKLTSLLITGDENQAPVKFSQGGGCCLEQENNGKWTLQWMIIPQLIKE